MSRFKMLIARVAKTNYTEVCKLLGFSSAESELFSSEASFSVVEPSDESSASSSESSSSKSRAPPLAVRTDTSTGSWFLVCLENHKTHLQVKSLTNFFF